MAPLTDTLDRSSVTTHVEVNGATPVEDALERIHNAARVAIRFDTFSDGRGFSLAVHLRERGFAGELIAVGDLLPDQLGFLQRSGFDRIESESHPDSPRWRRAGFSRVYQPSVGDAASQSPAFALRAAARRAK